MYSSFCHLVDCFLRTPSIIADIIFRVARNGDTANKIGTYQLAVLAKHHGIPFYVVCPLTTIDFVSKSKSTSIQGDNPAWKNLLLTLSWYRPAWTVGSYSSGQPAVGTVGTMSKGGFY